MIQFLTEQNEWTLPIFIIGIIVDFWAAYKVDKTVHDPKLYLVLIATIATNLIINLCYLLSGALFNISPICSAIMIVLLCWVLVERLEEKEERTKNVLNHIIKTKSGSKKQVCSSHYQRIMTQDFKDACIDCPLLEKT
ncbi:hypothetical protein N9H19_00810 [Flavobacteriales bacterium]|nr:hypothetical protein [Flavobacteriales bacterium]